MIRRTLDSLRRQAARSNLLSAAAAKARDQMNGVVFQHLGHDTDHRTNGEQLLVDHVAPAATTFVDVGANVGAWSSMFLASTSAPIEHALLFEPSESAGIRLRAALGHRPGVEIIAAAAGDRVGEIAFREEPEAGETSSVLVNVSRADAATRMVPMTTVDAELSSRDIDTVDLLKIDAEGFDLRVLNGARELLARQAARVVQFEYNDAWQRDGARLIDAFELLADHGYETRLLRGRGLFVLRYDIYGEYYHYSNFVAFPRGRPGALAPLLRGVA